MNTLGPTAAHTNARRGLATVAFLKTRFDAGMDHLDMFQPFVDDTIVQLTKDDVELADVQVAVRNSSGLFIPTDILKTLLRRATRQGLVTRQGGRYLRTQTYDHTQGHSEQMKELQRRHQGLAVRLRQHVASRGIALESEDDALAALMHFLDIHHIAIVLGQRVQPRTSVGVAKLSHAVATFVHEIINAGDSDRDVLEDIVKGLIVQNALLLRDIPSAGRRLKSLVVYLDTGILLRALGYAGPAELQATVEALDLIRAAGARLYQPEAQGSSQRDTVSVARI